MIDSDTIRPLPAADAPRARDRRLFLRSAGQAGIAAGGLALLSACGGSDSSSSATASPTATSTALAVDQDVLNVALTMAYLLAQYFAYASGGAGIAASLQTGTGTQGTTTGGRAVTFTDPIVAQYAREMAADTLAHVGLLRSILGPSAGAIPAINIDGSASGAFTTAARAAGVVTAPATFDPYASDGNFLLGAYLLADVAVTAYKGVLIQLATSLYIDALAGIMATQSYHAGLIRTTLYTKGATSPTLRTQAGQFSDWRDSLDGTSDDDQGITGTATASNVVPANANGFVYTRSPGQVLNILYQTNAAVVGGGFLPSGANGNIRTSAAN